MPDRALAAAVATVRRLGAAATDSVGRLGYAARFFVAVVANTPAAFRRLHLTLREIYFSGVLSLIIILVSGLFVGMVLALQGYDVLTRYGADESLGITSVVVTHDVYESLKIVDYLYFVSEGRIVAEGTPAEVRGSADVFVRQFVDGEPDGPVPFHYPARGYREELLADA